MVIVKRLERAVTGPASIFIWPGLMALWKWIAKQQFTGSVRVGWLLNSFSAPRLPSSPGWKQNNTLFLRWALSLATIWIVEIMAAMWPSWPQAWCSPLLLEKDRPDCSGKLRASNSHLRIIVSSYFLGVIAAMMAEGSSGITGSMSTYSIFDSAYRMYAEVLCS